MDDTNDQEAWMRRCEEEAFKLFKRAFIEKLPPGVELFTIHFHNLVKKLIAENPVEHGGELLKAYELLADSQDIEVDLSLIRLHIGRLAQSAIIVDEEWQRLFRRDEEHE